MLYSIKDELNGLRAFVRPEYGGEWRCYSEDEIIAAEERLHTILPTPIKDIYLLMADVLIERGYLRPLELLHWQQDHLAFFCDPNAPVCGIYRHDPSGTLYEWMEDDPEDQSYDHEEEFEACCQAGDEAGKQSVALQYAAYWDDINARYTESPEAVKKWSGDHRYQYALDGYGLFLALHAVWECAEELSQEQASVCFWAEPLPEALERPEQIARGYQNLRERIAREFVPLSAHDELIEAENLLLAYRHLNGDMLLICETWSGSLMLLTTPETAMDRVKAIGERLVLDLHALPL